MVRVQFLRPLHQATGEVRLLDELKACLASDEYDELNVCVAYARRRALVKLHPWLKEWRRSGKAVRAILGVDQRLTSRQALQYALETFNETYVTSVHGYRLRNDVTYHPKMYLFSGPTRAVAFVGSHNLTEGGLETNFEAGVRVDFLRPADEALYREAYDCWVSLLPPGCPYTRRLDGALLADLVATDRVCDDDEKQRRPGSRGTGAHSLPPPLHLAPPSPLPKDVMTEAASAPVRVLTAPSSAVPPSLPMGPASAKALVIQVRPHTNGEVFLSKRALDQNPAFFGLPWTGRATPKVEGNERYPHREPKPLVNIVCYGRDGKVRERWEKYPLTMVHYTNSDIRITISKLADHAPEMSILVMARGNKDDGIDYEMEVFPPGHPEYDTYRAACNQKLGSGGKSQSRWMGWI